MSTPKDPEVIKLTAQVARLEKVATSLLLRVQFLEKETKRLRGSVGRATDQVGLFAQRLPRK
jgi:hypothetical protein